MSLQSILNYRDLLLPLLLLAFVGGTTTFLSPIFNTTSRWAIVLGVLLYLLITGGLFRPLRTPLGTMLALSWFWTAMTVLWSEAPQLSLMKFVALVLVSLTGLAAGQAWVRRHEPTQWLNYLLPLTIVALAAGLLGQHSTGAEYQTSKITLYQGLVGNPNMFGSMLAMCSPFLMWQLYRHWRVPKKRLLWGLLSLITAYYLFRSGSRASILVVLFTCMGMLLALGSGKRIQIMIISAGMVIFALLMSPIMGNNLIDRFIYKGVTEQGFDAGGGRRVTGVFATREVVWEESWRLAQEGGWLGGGYGVTIGAEEFSGGLTSLGYGREKGNTQLAIMEEMGLVGLGIYAMLLLTLFKQLWRARRVLPPGNHRLILGLVMGTLAGMTVQSVFEAWWVAPGSPESLYFWTLTGIALGIIGESSKIRRHQASRLVTSTHPQAARLQYRCLGKPGN